MDGHPQTLSELFEQAVLHALQFSAGALELSGNDCKQTHSTLSLPYPARQRIDPGVASEPWV